MNHTQFIPLFLLNTHLKAQIIETTFFFFYHIRIKPLEV